MLNLAITPVVTEKSTLDAKYGKYHFLVPKSATKVDVAREIKAIYGKDVESVNIINSPTKHRMVGRGIARIKRKEKKKAIVTFVNKETLDIHKTK